MTRKNLESAVVKALKEVTPAGNRTARMLVAISGGGDSVALLELIAATRAETGVEAIAAHFSHGMRGESSDGRDADVVKAQCARIRVPLIVGSSAPGEIHNCAVNAGSGIEAAARTARYRFLLNAALLTGCSWVATGHTEDDQVETVVMAIERGVHPLLHSGIPFSRSLSDGLQVIRPLLLVSRGALRDYLRDRGIRWNEDETNRDGRMQRNRIRQVLSGPGEDAEKYRREILTRQNAAAERRAIASSGLPPTAWSTSRGVSTMGADTFFGAPVDARIVCLFEEARRRGLIRPSSRIPVSHFSPLLGERPSAGAVIRSRGQFIRVERGQLVWSADIVQSRESGYLRVVKPDVLVALPAGRIFVLRPRQKSTTVGEASVLELSGARGPVVVRSPRPGDRILVDSGWRLVADVLKRQKRLSSGERESAAIVDADGVAAIVGPESIVVRRAVSPGGVEWRGAIRETGVS